MWRAQRCGEELNWCCHFSGAKTHKTSELVRVVEKSGKSYTVKGEVGLSGLSPESRFYVELSDEGHSMCLSLEAAITAEEQRSTKKVPFFPITIGRYWERRSVLCVRRLFFSLNQDVIICVNLCRRPTSSEAPSSASDPSQQTPPDSATPPKPPQFTPSVRLPALNSQEPVHIKRMMGVLHLDMPQIKKKILFFSFKGIKGYIYYEKKLLTIIWPSSLPAVLYVAFLSLSSASETHYDSLL